MSLIAFLSLSFIPIVETIVLSEELTLDAEYMPAGEVLDSEGMVISLEDFVLLKGEIEISGHSCETRINYIQNLAFKEINRVSQIKEAKIQRLEILHSQNKRNHLNLLKKVESQENVTLFYKVSAGILLGSNIFLSLFLIFK